VDRGSSCEIEATEFKRPAIGVPGPISYRIVDDGGPDENENECWSKAATLSNGTNSERDSVSGVSEEGHDM